LKASPFSPIINFLVTVQNGGLDVGVQTAYLRSVSVPAADLLAALSGCGSGPEDIHVQHGSLQGEAITLSHSQAAGLPQFLEPGERATLGFSVDFSECADVAPVLVQALAQEETGLARSETLTLVMGTGARNPTWSAELRSDVSPSSASFRSQAIATSQEEIL